jgi:DNA-binding winged helix-turn-helix (wHTH) protein
VQEQTASSKQSTFVPRWRLGDVVIDALAKHVLVEGRRIDIDAQQVDVLLCLVRAYPGIVSKDALIDAVWGGPYVTDAALQKAISGLRRALREEGLAEDTIETRHRRGYQLTLAPVAADLPATTASAKTPAAVSDSSGVPRRRRSSMAIVLLACVVAIGVVVGLTLRRQPPVEPAAEPAAATPPEQLARLARLDDDALVDTIKSALASDPAWAAAATAELRRRGATRPAAIALADKYAGVLAYRAGQFDAARVHYTAALAGFRNLDDRVEEANVLNNLGVLLAESGRDPVEAESLYRQSLAIRESLADAAAVMASHRNLSNLLLETGALDRAEAAVVAYSASADRIGTAVDQVEARILRGDVVRGRGGDPRGLYREAIAAAGERGLPLQAAAAWQRIGKEDLRADQPDAARAAFEEAIALYAQGDPGHQLPWLTYNLATAIEAQGRIDEALARYGDVLELAAGLADSSLAIDARLNRARLLARRGEHAAAAQLLDAAWRDAEALDNPMVRTGVRLARADQALLAGETVAARGHVEEARADLEGHEHWELSAGTQLASAKVAIAERAYLRAREELSALASQAEVRADAQVGTSVRAVAAMLAFAEGRAADGFREWPERPPTVARQAAVHQAADAPTPWGPPLIAFIAGVMVTMGCAAWRWRGARGSANGRATGV